MLTIIFIVCVALFAFIGYRKGIIKLTFRFLSLLGAYIAAILFTASLGSYLNENSQLNGILGYLVAGLTLFIATSLILSALFAIINKLITRDDAKLSTPAKVAGGAAGALVGGIVGILLVWVISISGQLLEPSNPALVDHETPEDMGVVEHMAKKITGSAIKTAITATTDQPEFAELTSKLLESPQVAIQHMRGITDSTEFRDLFLAARNQQILNSGNIDQIKQIPAFKQLMANQHFQAISEGIIDPDSELSYDDQMAEKIRDMWARAQFVKNDPATQAVFNDPELKQLINQGNLLQLLNSQKVVELFERIMSEEANQYSEQLKQLAPLTTLTKTTEEAVKKNKIYKWVDEHGRVHYSDKKPEDQ